MLDLDILFVAKMIVLILMNSYIKSEPTDENNKNEYIEFSNKCCIGCIPSYTYVYCVYINKEYVAPE